MVYAGARGDTATQLAAALHFGLPGDQLHAAFNDLDHQLSRPAPSPGPAGDPLTLELTNALWSQDGYPMRQQFLDVLAADYGAGMHLVDFIRDPEASRLAINASVAANTHGRITNLLAKGDIDKITRLVLVNAVYFHAGWMHPFTPHGQGLFTRPAGQQVPAAMMAETAKLAYASAPDYEAARLPYVGGASMTVILPRTGQFSQIEAGLNAAFVASVTSRLTERELTLQMPRFRFSTALNLIPPLRQLGMVKAFDGGADFTGVTQQERLYLKAVKHQAFVSVDEKGTEAAAATGVVADAVSAAAPATMTIDRPFIFLIQDDATGTVLFAGRVTDPSA
jgi:serpin B